MQKAVQQPEQRRINIRQAVALILPKAGLAVQIINGPLGGDRALLAINPQIHATQYKYMPILMKPIANVYVRPVQ